MREHQCKVVYFAFVLLGKEKPLIANPRVKLSNQKSKMENGDANIKKESIGNATVQELLTTLKSTKTRRQKLSQPSFFCNPQAQLRLVRIVDVS